MAFDNDFKKEVFRKSVHMSSLWIVFAIWLMPRDILITLFSVITFLIFISEYARNYSKNITNLYQKLFGSILRSHESKGSFSGAFYIILATLIAITFFDKLTAMVAISIVIISDSVAAIIGTKYGKHKLLGKSWEGSLAFLLSAFLIIVGFFGLEANLFYVALIALSISFVELISKKINIDDNLSIVLATCFLIKILL